MAQIQLSESQLSDLAAICELEPETLKGVSAHLSNLDSLPLHPARLLSEIRESLGEHSAFAEPLMRQCLSFQSLMRVSDWNLEELSEELNESVDRLADWKTGLFDKWKRVFADFIELLNQQPFRIVANAIELAYEYANLYRKARIITDIRPLYTQDADSIEGAVVSYTLRLRYDNSQGDHELSLAMDESDVHDLQSQCARAINKARTARTLMNEVAEVPTIITGEQEHD
jgi:hypothetical protein